MASTSVSSATLPTTYCDQQLEAVAMCVPRETVPMLRRNFGVDYPVLHAAQEPARP